MYGMMFEGFVMVGWDGLDHEVNYPWPELLVPPTGTPYADSAAARADLPGLAARADPGTVLHLPAWQSLGPPHGPPPGPELLVEIHVPIVNLDGGDQFEAMDHRIEKYLCTRGHGGVAEWYDDGEQVGDNYAYFIWRADEEGLISVARNVAALPGVPPGVFAFVTATDAPQFGMGRRVEITTGE